MQSNLDVQPPSSLTFFSEILQENWKEDLLLDKVGIIKQLIKICSVKPKYTVSIIEYPTKYS